MKSAILKCSGLRAFWRCLVVLSLFRACPVAAQQPVPLRRVEFLDSARHVLPGEAGAHYRRETEYADSAGATIKTYYLPSGKLCSQQGYDDVRKGRPHGLSEWWYPNGQLHIHEEFEHGRSVGELRLYYPNGQLKRRELYGSKDAFASTGECFAENGQPVSFFKFEQMPVYPEGDGGNLALVKAIQRGVKYPRAALKERCAGRAIVGFNVTADGEVADIRILQGLCPSIDEAVLESVRRLKRFKPGRQDGQPVVVGFTVPVTFSLL